MDFSSSAIKFGQNERSLTGLSAIHVAAIFGSLAAVRERIRLGDDCNEISLACNNKASHLALLNNAYDVHRLLSLHENGAQNNNNHSDRETPLSKRLRLNLSSGCDNSKSQSNQHSSTIISRLQTTLTQLGALTLDRYGQRWYDQLNKTFKEASRNVVLGVLESNGRYNKNKLLKDLIFDLKRTLNFRECFDNKTVKVFERSDEQTKFTIYFTHCVGCPLSTIDRVDSRSFLTGSINPKFWPAIVSFMTNAISLYSNGMNTSSRCKCTSSIRDRTIALVYTGPFDFPFGFKIVDAGPVFSLHPNLHIRLHQLIENGVIPRVDIFFDGYERLSVSSKRFMQVYTHPLCCLGYHGSREPIVGVVMPHRGSDEMAPTKAKYFKIFRSPSSASCFTTCVASTKTYMEQNTHSDLYDFLFKVYFDQLPSCLSCIEQIKNSLLLPLETPVDVHRNDANNEAQTRIFRANLIQIKKTWTEKHQPNPCESSTLSSDARNRCVDLSHKSRSCLNELISRTNAEIRTLYNKVQRLNDHSLPDAFSRLILLETVNALKRSNLLVAQYCSRIFYAVVTMIQDDVSCIFIESPSLQYNYVYDTLMDLVVKECCDVVSDFRELEYRLSNAHRMFLETGSEINFGLFTFVNRIQQPNRLLANDQLNPNFEATLATLDSIKERVPKIQFSGPCEDPLIHYSINSVMNKPKLTIERHSESVTSYAWLSSKPLSEIRTLVKSTAEPISPVFNLVDQSTPPSRSWIVAGSKTVNFIVYPATRLDDVTTVLTKYLTMEDCNAMRIILVELPLECYSHSEIILYAADKLAVMFKIHRYWRRRVSITGVNSNTIGCIPLEDGLIQGQEILTKIENRLSNNLIKLVNTHGSTIKGIHRDAELYGLEDLEPFREFTRISHPTHPNAFQDLDLAELCLKICSVVRTLRRRSVPDYTEENSDMISFARRAGRLASLLKERLVGFSIPTIMQPLKNEVMLRRAALKYNGLVLQRTQPERYFHRSNPTLDIAEIHYAAALLQNNKFILYSSDLSS